MCLYSVWPQFLSCFMRNSGYYLFSLVDIHQPNWNLPVELDLETLGIKTKYNFK